MTFMFDEFFPKALFISVALHTVVITSSLLWHTSTAKKETGTRVEISVRPASKKVDVKQHPIKSPQRLDLKSRAIGSGSIPIKLGDESRPLPSNFMAQERRPEQIRSAQMTHRISIVPIKSEKVNNPAYASYNEMVRSRIEEKVYENYRRMEAGAVYLTFIIASDGSLKGAQIIDEKTKASDNLKGISLASLKQADFPPFLKGMTLPEYTFNIEIQFQVKD